MTSSREDVVSRDHLGPRNQKPGVSTPRYLLTIRMPRHLIHVFPGAEIHSYDIDVNEFRASTFGKASLLREQRTEIEFAFHYEIVREVDGYGYGIVFLAITTS